MVHYTIIRSTMMNASKVDKKYIVKSVIGLFWKLSAAVIQTRPLVIAVCRVCCLLLDRPLTKTIYLRQFSFCLSFSLSFSLSLSRVPRIENIRLSPEGMFSRSINCDLRSLTTTREMRHRAFTTKTSSDVRFEVIFLPPD